MSEKPADGEYWVVLRLADQTRAVAVAQQIGMEVSWVLLDELADPSAIEPLFPVNLYADRAGPSEHHGEEADPHDQSQAESGTGTEA